MRFLILPIVLACLLSPSLAVAWFDNGHMAISRYAWNKLSADERRQATEILKRHPHYDEFLKAECPEGVPQEEWVFLRASVWPDFVRNTHSEKYNKPTWHYIECPLRPGLFEGDAAGRRPDDDQRRHAD